MAVCTPEIAAASLIQPVVRSGVDGANLLFRYYHHSRLHGHATTLFRQDRTGLENPIRSKADVDRLIVPEYPPADGLGFRHGSPEKLVPVKRNELGAADRVCGLALHHLSDWVEGVFSAASSLLRQLASRTWRL